MKSKSEVNYSKGMKQSHCGKVFKDDTNYCKHYSDYKCDLVEGEINPVYWCRLFEKAK